MLPERRRRRRRRVWTPRNQEEGLTMDPTLGTMPLLPPSTPEAPGAAQKLSPSPKLLLDFLSPASPSPFLTSFSLPFFCSSNTPRMFPPQGLCACSSLCPEHLSMKSLQAWLLLSPQVSPPQSSASGPPPLIYPPQHPHTTQSQPFPTHTTLLYFLSLRHSRL